MNKLDNKFEIWIMLDEKWNIVSTVTEVVDSNKHEIDIILNLTEKEYNDYLNWNDHRDDVKLTPVQSLFLGLLRKPDLW